MKGGLCLEKIKDFVTINKKRNIAVQAGQGRSKSH